MTRTETRSSSIDAWTHGGDTMSMRCCWRIHRTACSRVRLQGKVTGHAAIANVYRGFLASFPDLSVDLPELVVEDGHVVQLVTFSSTNTGGFMGVPATGKKFAFAAALICAMRDGRIAHERRIYDFTGFLVEIESSKQSPPRTWKKRHG